MSAGRALAKSCTTAALAAAVSLLVLAAAGSAQERTITDARTGLNLTIETDPTWPEGSNLVIRMGNWNGPDPNVDGSNINAPPLNVNISAFERQYANVNGP